MKILTIFGTRPEAIKLAPVIAELGKYPLEFHSVTCTTAQHREMIDQVLRSFDIRPDHDLDVMRPNQSLSELTANLLPKLSDVVSTESPDWILVQGDTTTVMVAALVAYYHRIKLGHVEAGLRTENKWQPFPEEINRRVTDVLTDLYFAPTEHNRKNLLREGVEASSIIVTGNTVVDALLMTVACLQKENTPPPGYLQEGRKPILVTAHRRESFGQPLIEICEALREIASRRRDVQIVYPVHPNPNVAGPARRMLSGLENVTLTEPLGYSELVQLMRHAHLILTDSGGIQEEAPSLQVPVLVMRAVTERPEGIAAGVVRLVGTSRHEIVREVCRILENSFEYELMARGANPYGDGQASRRIVEALRRHRQGWKARW